MEFRSRGNLGDMHQTPETKEEYSANFQISENSIISFVIIYEIFPSYA